MSSPQERVQHFVGILDKELAKYPAIANLERTTGLPKAYAFIGFAALYLFLIIFNLGGQFLTNLAGFAIPGYYSMNALFTSNTADDTQWLTYWVVFSFFSVIESLVSVVYWFPFYFTFKFIFLLWLALPMFNGANFIYRSFMVPMLGRYFAPGSTASNLRARAEGAAKTD